MQPDTRPPEAAGPGTRLGITLGVTAAVVLAGRIPLPFLDLTPADAGLPRAGLTVLAVGLVPVITAFIGVELLALALPAWRRARLAGPEGRARLAGPVWILAGVLAVVLSLGWVLQLEQVGMVVGPGWMTRLTQAVTLVGGTFLLVAGAGLVERAGLVPGFSAVLVALHLDAVWQGARLTPRLGVPGVGAAQVLMAVGLALAVALITWRTFVAGPAARPEPRERPMRLRLPASGLVPLQAGTGLLLLGGMLAPLAQAGFALPSDRYLTGSVWYDQTSLIVVLLLGLGLSPLFNRPDLLARAWAGGRGVPEKLASYRRTAIALLPQAILRTEVWLAFVWAAAGFTAGTLRLPALALTGVVAAVVVTAVVLDAAAEWRFRRRHGPLVAVWPLHRAYAVDPVLEGLELAGIPCHARGLHHRLLLHFFGPFVPITLMVRAQDAEEAREVVGTIVSAT